MYMRLARKGLFASAKLDKIGKSTKQSWIFSSILFAEALEYVLKCAKTFAKQKSLLIFAPRNF